MQSNRPWELSTVPRPKYTGAMLGFRAMLGATALVGAAAAQQSISFPTRDGGLIFADAYGRGERAIVLAHGGRFDRKSWASQAKVLAEAGFRVMAIDFRGEGESRGGSQSRSLEDGRPLDILAAVDYSRKAGAKSVSVVAASMGGDYAAEAAEVEPTAIDRLVLLASGAYTPLTHMRGRKLFLVARDDANSDGPRLPRIRAQYAKALGPKELIVVDGSAHAQLLFDTDQGERVMREILRFLRAP